MAKDNPTVNAERAVLCVLLNDSHAIIPVMDVLDSPDQFSTDTHRAVYAAILELTRAAIVPNVYTVSEKAGIALAELQGIATGFNTKLSKEVLYTADMVRKDAAQRKVQAALADCSELAKAKTDDPHGLAQYCAEYIIGSVDHKEDASPAIGEVSKRFDAEVAAIANGDAGISLGPVFEWLQGKTAGFRQGHVWVIIAPYKGRKTTLMRNLIIAPCRAGASVDIFALEGTETGTYAGLVAMLATEKLIAWGAGDKATLSETFVLRGTKTAQVQAAVNDARAEVDAWNLRIYDGRKGITQPDRLLHYIKRDRIIHGLNLFTLDYLQLLGDGKLFERMEAATRRLQQITVEEGITAILLGQQNEAAIQQAQESYSPGVKGGGDAAAASDFLLRTKYDGATAPNVLTIQLKLARHARPGAQQYLINPQSGLLLRAYDTSSDE